ncbi:aldo/keto reductase [Myceligenerans halotolerans]
MRYTLLGQSGLRVSEVGLGTMTFGTDWGFGGDAKEARRMVDTFAAAGGNFIDTANNYTNGTSESLVGEAVSDDRDRWVVGTKYTLASRDDDLNAAGNSLKNLRRTVETSLRRLRTDYIDVLWLHAWDDLTPVEEVMRGLDTLTRAGKVLYVGISDSPVWAASYGQALAHLRGWSPFVGLQVPWSLADRDVEREFVPMAQALGMGVCAWGPLSGGLLSGKYAEGQPAAGTTRRPRQNADRLKIAARVHELARERGIGSAEMALAWLRSRGAIPLIGARTADQLESNLACVDIDLEPGEVESLEAASPVDLGFSRGFLDSMTNVIHGPGLRSRIDVPPSYRR